MGDAVARAGGGKAADKAPRPNKWRQDEVVMFERLLVVYGKDFAAFAEWLPGRDMKGVVAFYYSWKTTPRGIAFRQQYKERLKKTSGNTLHMSFIPREFKIERLLDHKGSEGNRLFKVRWAGYGPEHDTWEPESEISKTAHYEKYIESLLKPRREKRTIVKVLAHRHSPRGFLFQVEWGGAASGKVTWELRQVVRAKNQQALSSYLADIELQGSTLEEAALDADLDYDDQSDASEDEDDQDYELPSSGEWSPNESGGEVRRRGRKRARLR